MPSALPLTPPASPKSGNGDLTSKHEIFSIGSLWWNANVPTEDWTRECPDYLEGQCGKNISILTTKDSEHPRTQWSEVKGLIDSGRIDQFHRMPSDLRRYLKYCDDLKHRYGSILYFMQHVRLDWPTTKASGAALFSNEADYKILYNDWPYSIEEDIIHIVVWTKFELEDDSQTGELKQEHTVLIDEFVANTFCKSHRGEAVMRREDIRWFKNCRSLKSVHALEHIHIMLYRPPLGLIQRVTNGDKPMCEQFEM